MTGGYEMHYKTFDTHKYIKSLQDTGFNEQQAEMLVKSLLESRDFDLSILATREQVSDVRKEIADTRAELKGDIAATREQVSQLDTKLSKEISDVKHSLTKWMMAQFMATLALVAALIVKLFI